MSLVEKVKNVTNDTIDKSKNLANETIDKSKAVVNNTIDKGKQSIENSKIAEKISQGINDSVEQIMKDNDEFYKNHPVPTIDSVKSIINDCANKNAVISGGVGLIPGPWGIAAAIPEIAHVMKNQMDMIYKIGKAHGQKITSELIIGILLGAIGQGSTALIFVQAQKVMAKQKSQQALQKVINALGGKITQKMIKTEAAKWLPVVGAVAMATWSKYTTHKIADKAIEIFSKEIVYDENITNDVDEEILEIEIETKEDINHFTILKIQSFINLMKIDGIEDDDELKFIKDFIDCSELLPEEKIELISQITNKDSIKIDYTIFKENEDEKLSLILDLVTLSKADGNIHITEKMYIENIGKLLEFDKDDLEELLG